MPEDTPVEEPLPTREFPAEEDPFGLDAIMREFSGEKEAEPLPVTGDTVRIELPEQPAEAEPVTSDTIRIDLPVSGDTIRIDLPVNDEDAPVSNDGEDTIRIDLPEKKEQTDVTGDTVRFDPITEETDSGKVEPYSDGWEPEYEQPIGE